MRSRNIFLVKICFLSLILGLVEVFTYASFGYLSFAIVNELSNGVSGASIKFVFFDFEIFAYIALALVVILRIFIVLPIFYFREILVGRFYALVLELSGYWHSSNVDGDSGIILKKIHQDSDALVNGFWNSIFWFFSEVLIIIGFFGVLIYSSPQFGFFVICFILAIGVLFRYTLGSVAMNFGRRRIAAGDKLSSELRGLAGSRMFTCRSGTARLYLLRRLRSSFDEYSRLLGVTSFFSGVPKFFVDLFLALVLFFILFMPNSDSFSSTDAILLAIVFRLLPAVSRCFTQAQTAFGYRSVFGRTRQLLHDAEEALSNDVRAPLSYDECDSSIELPRHIEVSVSHRRICNGRAVSFCLFRDRINWIVGESGVGKTSLAKLLAGIQADSELSGILELKHEGGIFDLSDKDVFESIDFVPQDAFFFYGTVLENICWGKKLSRENLLALAKAVGFHEELDVFFDRVVDGDGSSVSGGQASRINLLRAVVWNKPVLIFDEPLAALDAETTSLVTEFIRRTCLGKIVILVSHDLSQVKSHDNVIRLIARNGNILS